MIVSYLGRLKFSTSKKTVFNIISHLVKNPYCFLMVDLDFQGQYQSRIGSPVPSATFPLDPRQKRSQMVQLMKQERLTENLTGDSWMYPYQRTLMGNPYISPIYPYNTWVFMGYYPQESLYMPYKYHGYTVRGTPNCPLIHRKKWCLNTVAVVQDQTPLEGSIVRIQSISKISSRKKDASH